VACTKKRKNILYLVVLEHQHLSFLHETHKNIFFFQKLICEHRMSRYTYTNLLHNFLTLQNVFSHNEFICTRVPIWISRIRVSNLLLHLILLQPWGTNFGFIAGDNKTLITSKQSSFYWFSLRNLTMQPFIIYLAFLILLSMLNFFSMLNFLLSV
jgi:hypothetical protein